MPSEITKSLIRSGKLTQEEYDVLVEGFAKTSSANVLGEMLTMTLIRVDDLEKRVKALEGGTS